MLANFDEVGIVGEILEKQVISFCDLHDATRPKPSTDPKGQEKDSEEGAKKNSKE